MKRILAGILFPLGLISSVHAQSELQFSQSVFIHLEGTVDAIGAVDSHALVVPEGKTVKITSAGTGIVETIGGEINAGGNAVRLIINGCVMYFGASNTDANSSFPIWLPTGTYPIVLYSSYSNPNVGPVANGFISGVEFNLE